MSCGLEHTAVGTEAMRGRRRRKIAAAAARTTWIVFSFLTVSLGLPACGTQPPASFANQSTVSVTAPSDDGTREVGSAYAISGVDNAGRSVQYIVRAPTSSGVVDTSDITVSFECAKKWSFEGDPNGLRVALLEQGCAVLDADAGTTDEKAAQTRAQDARLGAWASSGSAPISSDTAGTTAPPEQAVDNFGQEQGISNWLAALWVLVTNYWQFVVGILLTVISAWQFQRFWQRRRVRMVLAGLPGTGKTALWFALRSRTSRQAPQAPTVGLSAPEQLRPERFGNYTIIPIAIDSAGSEPQHILDQSTKTRLSSHWKNKRFLIVVCAPTRLDKPRTDESVFDERFITLQEGYMSLPTAIIGASSRRIRPDCVILFITKFDLIAQHAPADRASREQEQLTRRYFAPHAAILRTACEHANIPLAEIIGSSLENWGIEDLMTQLSHVLPSK